MHRDRTWLPLGIGCVTFGAAALAIATAYPYGTVTAMGPGFVPTAISILLMVFGAVILARRGGDVQAEAHDPAPGAELAQPSEGPWRAMLAIGAAIVIFGLGIGRLGLPITAFLVVMLSGFAMPQGRLVPLTILAAVLAIGASLLFIGGLGLNLKVWPQFS